MEAYDELSREIEALSEGDFVNDFRIAARNDYSAPPASFAEDQSLISSPSNPNSIPPSTTQPEALKVTADVSGLKAAKKKRGRPKKYGPDGPSPLTALSPMPLSSSIPITGEFSSWKMGSGKTVETLKKYKKHGHEPSEKIAYTVGASFTPHVLIVNPGEDVMEKVMSFAQQGCRAISILAANGTLSNFTLQRPNSSGTLTYEGRFEILSLCGSFIPSKVGSGGMCISLAGPDGRVVGGGISGSVVAAGPVQVVVGSYLPGHNLEHKQKKQKVENNVAFSEEEVHISDS